MRDKVISLDEAASIVRDGNQVAMSSGFTWAPMALLRQIARRGAKNLEVICRGGSINVDFLVGTGQACSVESCSLGFAPFARVAPNFDRFLKAGKVYANDNT